MIRCAFRRHRATCGEKRPRNKRHGGGDGRVTDERENAEKMTNSKERGREAVKYVLGIFPTSEERRGGSVFLRPRT